MTTGSREQVGTRQPPWRRRGAVAALTLLLGCGGSGTTPDLGDPGTISGKTGGKTVDHVASAYFIGQGDDPSHTIVVYVFDTTVSCADLGSAGWDQTITSGTGALEMKLIGTAAGKYPVAAGRRRARGKPRSTSR